MLVNRLICLAWGCGVSITLVQPLALANSGVKVNDFAQLVAVKTSALNSTVSGALLQQGNIHAAMTANDYVTSAKRKYDRGDNRGALADYDKAISLNPKLAQAYYGRAAVKVNSNNFRGALADVNQTISLDPKYAEAYGGRGWLKYEKLNDHLGGIADMRQAAKLARAEGNTEILQRALQTLKSWNASE